MLEVALVEQLVIVGVTQPFDARITTTKVEIFVLPNMEVVKKGILIGFVAKLSSGSSGILIGRNVSRSSTLPTITTRVVGTLPTITTRVVGTPRTVFINPIMIIHVNRIAD